MVEGLLMLGMLAFMFLLFLQSRHLTDRVRKKRRSIGLFEFKLNLHRTAPPRKHGSVRKKG